MIDRREIKPDLPPLSREELGLDDSVNLIDFPATQAPGKTPGIWKTLSRLGRLAESEPSDLPNDLAINHDHYLHGRPKRS